MRMLEPLSDRFGDRREPTIGIGTAACWIGFMVVLIGVFLDERIGSCFHLCLCTSTIPDDEAISALYDLISRIVDGFSIDEIVEMCISRSGMHISERFAQIIRPYTPVEICKEISPRRCRHMDMDEVSLTIMEMDTILRLHIGRHIAPRGLLHIVRSIETLSLAVDVHGEVGMPVDHVGARREDVGESCGNGYDDESEEEFFHESSIL